jgi:hypothetical protein
MSDDELIAALDAHARHVGGDRLTGDAAVQIETRIRALIAERDAMTEKYNKAFWRTENATAEVARLKQYVPGGGISDDEDDIVRRVREVDSDLAIDVAHALGERSREVARLIAERDEYQMWDGYERTRALDAEAEVARLKGLLRDVQARIIGLPAARGLHARITAALATEDTP